MIVANDVDSQLMKRLPLPLECVTASRISSCHSPMAHMQVIERSCGIAALQMSSKDPRRHSAPRAVPARRRNRRADDETRIVCRKTFQRRRVLVRRALSGLSAHAGRAPVRGGDAGRRDPAGRSSPANDEGACRSPTRHERRAVQTHGPPGDTIEMEVELIERLADAFFLTAKVTVRRQDRRAASNSPARLAPQP